MAKRFSSLARLPWKLSLLLCLGGCGFAQAPPGSFQVGYEDGRLYGGSLAKGTTALYHGRVQLDDNLEKGFWFATRLKDDWSVEGSVRRCSTDLVQPGPGVWASQPKVAGLDYAILEGALRRSVRFGQCHPYWRAGTGLATLDLEPPQGLDQHRHRASFSAGGGAEFWMAPGFAFRFDLRAHAIYLGARGQGQDQGLLDGGRWLRTQEILAGMQASF